MIIDLINTSAGKPKNSKQTKKPWKTGFKSGLEGLKYTNKPKILAMSSKQNKNWSSSFMAD